MSAPGSFVWYELATPDADAAQRFYTDVVGWAAADAGMPGLDYRIVSAPDGDAIGALMQPPATHAGPTLWRAYVEVTDVDAQVAAITAAGGAVHLPPMDVPDVGRMAMLADPQGATFYILRTAGEDSRAFLPATQARPGHAVWNDLAAPDPHAAIAFYTDRFGWHQDGAMPMGDAGDYSFLRHGDTMVGAVMPVAYGAAPGWRVFFHVPDIDRAADRVRAGGGQVVHGPDQILGGDWSVVADDPGGARFGLVGKREG